MPTITLRNDKYLDIFPGVEQDARVELGIRDQGSWHVALMMAQSHSPNLDLVVGHFLVSMAAESDQNHGLSEKIMAHHTSEEEDEREPRSHNRPGSSRSENSGEEHSRF